jgi:uncharacterized protein involved in outer membrane biogenesis
LAAAAVALAGIAAVLIVALMIALGAGAFRRPLLAFLASRFERPIAVGSLRVELWSRHPRILAQHVTIGNPSWVAAGDMARIERLTLVFGVPGFGGAGLESIVAEGTTLELVRDDSGRANWQRYDPESGRLGKGIPLLRELSALDIHLELDDELRHLHFDGMVSARGPRQTLATSRLHMEAKGSLNGRPADLELNGDPLESVHRDTPYAFDLVAQSSGARVNLHGTLPAPFDFNVMTGSFAAAGADLADLHYLTGLSLPHSGAYRLTGSIERRGTHSRFDQLKLTTGQSEIAGSLSTQRENGGRPPRRTLLQGTVRAAVLHLADFGARAAGQGSEPPVATPPRMFSDAPLNAAGLRRRDVRLRIEAARVDVGRTQLHALSGQLKIDQGLVDADARGEVMQGSFEARLTLDATKQVPAADLRARFENLQLATLAHEQAQPPLSGLLQARIDLTGQGDSLHQVAAGANGTISLTLPHGSIRASLAELAGVDLRGLGLVVARSKRETTVRCASAIFEAHDGTFTANPIVIDTDPVVIRGEGVIRLDTESLDIALRGEPKDARVLRVDAPLRLRGTLLRPSFAVQIHDSSVKLFDPGHGKNVDCESLVAAGSNR